MTNMTQDHLELMTALKLIYLIFGGGACVVAMAESKSKVWRACWAAILVAGFVFVLVAPDTFQGWWGRH